MHFRSFGHTINFVKHTKGAKMRYSGFFLMDMLYVDIQYPRYS